ncbi:MAG: 4-hydroxythreonine-4-phosphate dehydrogenase PdxA [Oscillospiraceae bacterium]|nr:4-hydroxythreonine-4-phosphate dehydrogenase PdxA [Oscillospiraceae bacterium]
MDQKPILGITMGDPAGIGPEIAAKALTHEKVYEMCRPLVIGDAEVMKQALGIAKVDGKIRINPVAKVEDARFQYGVIDVFDLHNVDISKLVYGKVSAMCGKAAFEAVEKVIELAKSGEIDATVTGPINKEAINAAGFHFSGHTEIYAHFTGTQDYSMLLAEGNLRVVHVSTHVSLRRACDLVKKDRVLDVIKLAYDACRKFGIGEPKIGVAGLNPHAGENGMFGNEETDEIIPAIEAAKKAGINAEGPIPPDTLYSKAAGGLYDIVVAMYHDQGHIPLKVLGFKWNGAKNSWDAVSGVNVTLGLPIIRISVDHGTAFGKAGKGTAIEDSLLGAIEYGIKLTRK